MRDAEWDREKNDPGKRGTDPKKYQRTDGCSETPDIPTILRRDVKAQ